MILINLYVRFEVFTAVCVTVFRVVSGVICGLSVSLSTLAGPCNGEVLESSIHAYYYLLCVTY
jgi:hypothetical protein